MATQAEFERVRALLEEHQYAEGLAALHELEEEKGSSPIVEYGKGVCLAALGRTTEARAALRHLRDMGEVALAQQLAARLTSEDPLSIEPVAATAPAAYRPRVEEPQFYRIGFYVASAIVLVLAGILAVTWTLDSSKQAASTKQSSAPTESLDAATGHAGVNHDKDTAELPVSRVGAEAKTATPAAPQPTASTSIVGHWVSVAFVQRIEEYVAGTTQPASNLMLKELRFSEDGTASARFDGPWSRFFLVWSRDQILEPKSGIHAPYQIKTLNGSTYLFLPWLSGDVTERGQKPMYYVLRSAGGAPAPRAEITDTSSPFGEIRLAQSVAAFDDIRYKDLRQLSGEVVAPLVATLTFNLGTVWPPLTGENDPSTVLELAKNPGLGVRSLHELGITGKGVSVGIIDQPLFDDHPEYAGKIVAYRDFGCNTDSSMHGPGVASLLVGSHCGTAPDAKLYYAAAPSWLKDASYYARALDWLIEQNAPLPTESKIRVVSVSAAPSGPGSLFTQNGAQWDEACARAEAAGILVLDCTGHRGIIAPCYCDPTARDDVTRCTPGFPGRPGAGRLSTSIFVPCSYRTTAEEYTKGEFSYQYNGRGGLSWSIPYAAGVLAMGWQVRPELSAQQMTDLLRGSAYEAPDGNKFIDPPAFFEAVKGT